MAVIKRIASKATPKKIVSYLTQEEKTEEKTEETETEPHEDTK